jgi:protein-disulfide isomerase
MPVKNLWVAAVVLAAAFGAPAARKSALDKANMEEYVRRLFVWGPQIQVKVEDPKPSKNLPGFLDVAVIGTAGNASKTEMFYVSKDGQKIVRGDVFNIADSPFAADEAKLDTKGAPTFGKPSAPVQIVVFSDFECGYCKEESKVLRENVKTTYPEQVQVTYIDFPLQAIHPWAMQAAEAGRCILRLKPAAYWDFHDYMFEHQAEITADNVKQKVLDFASSHSLVGPPLTTCMETHATAAEVAHSQQIGKSLDINSTPTLFINGRRIAGGIPWPNLQQIIDYELDYRKTHPNVHSDKVDSDKCCELTLPTPLRK